MSYIVNSCANDFLIRDCYLLVEKIRNLHNFQEIICKEHLTGIWNVSNVSILNISVNSKMV